MSDFQGNVFYRTYGNTPTEQLRTVNMGQNYRQKELKKELL